MHTGQVVSMTPQTTTVRIVSQSACAQCPAAGLCGGLHRLRPFHLAVVVDDDRRDQRDHDDAVDPEDDAQGPADGGGGRDVAKADRRHDGEAVPQAVPEGMDRVFIVFQHEGEGHDRDQQAEDDLEGVGLLNDILQDIDPDLGEHAGKDGQQGGH